MTIHYNEKYLAPNITDDENLMSEEKPCVDPVIYESTDGDLVSRSFWVNIVGCTETLAFSNYSSVNTYLRKAFPKVIKKV